MDFASTSLVQDNTCDTVKCEGVMENIKCTKIVKQFCVDMTENDRLIADLNGKK